MAVDEEMAFRPFAARIAQSGPEVEDRLHVLANGRDHARQRVDDVVEAKRRAVVLAVIRERRQVGAVGIDHGKHMRDRALAMVRQLVDAADGEKGNGGGNHRQTFRAR